MRSPMPSIDGKSLKIQVEKRMRNPEMPPITGTHSCHVILYSLGTKWPPAAAYQERSPVRYVSGSSVARCESARAVGSAVARSWGGPSSANQSRRRPAAATAESAPGQRLPGKVWALSFRFSPCGDGFRFGSGPAGRVLGEEREDWDEPRRQRVVYQRGLPGFSRRWVRG